MKSKLIHEDGQRTYAVVFGTGDEFMSGIKSFAAENGLDASQFTAIGAFSHALLGFFDFEKKDYLKIPVEEQVEVLSLVGDITREEDGVEVHAHVVLGQVDGTARGGHILEAHVRPTLEVIVTESPGHLHRKTDKETGLTLISLPD